MSSKDASARSPDPALMLYLSLFGNSVAFDQMCTS